MNVHRMGNICESFIGWRHWIESWYARGVQCRFPIFYNFLSDMRFSIRLSNVHIEQSH